MPNWIDWLTAPIIGEDFVRQEIDTVPEPIDSSNNYMSGTISLGDMYSMIEPESQTFRYNPTYNWTITNNTSGFTNLGTISNDGIIYTPTPPATPEPEPMEPWYGGCGLGRCACMGTLSRDRRGQQPIVGMRWDGGQKKYMVEFIDTDGIFKIWTYFAASERMARAYHDFYWPGNKPLNIVRCGPNRNGRPSRQQVDSMVQMREFGQFTVDPERMY